MTAPFFTGLFLTMFGKAFSYLWPKYREAEGSRRKFVWWKKLLDYFFGDGKAWNTTLLTVAGAGVLLLVYTGDVGAFLGFEWLQGWPQHGLIAFFLGVIAELVVPKIVDKIGVGRAAPVIPQ